jgi:5-methylcytosine-specific restriction endonuclease McrA
MREAKEVHHIKHLEDYPELAFDDNNLISLCSACHRKMHPEKGSLRMNYRGDRYFMN